MKAISWISLAMAATMIVPLVQASQSAPPFPESPRAPANVTVVAALFNFVSPVLVIPTGTTVTWQLVQSLNGLHTVTTGSIANAGPVPECAANTVCGPDQFYAELHGPSHNAPVTNGPTFSHAFTTTGVFTYFCVPHYGFGMRGVVVVA